MTERAPFVTVLIPAKNEEADIERCVRHVSAQDHPHDRMEIVLVDGGSTDSTVDVATQVLAEGDIPWTVLENPIGTTPSNLNTGLDAAVGDLLCRVDARSMIPVEYVRLCSEVLSGREEVVVTGGAQLAVAVNDSALALGIARALNNRYAMGGSRYRSGAPSGPSDTVYLGAFRTAQLREAGGWDELMLTNQDFELNRRLGRDGVVFFDGRLRVGYIPRPTLVSLLAQYHRFGRSKVRYWRHTGDRPARRQWFLLSAGVGGSIALTAVAFLGRTQPARTGVVAVLGSASLLAAVDHLGASEPEGGASARAVASVAASLVAAGWLSGVFRELLVSPRLAALSGGRRVGVGGGRSNSAPR